MATLTGAKLGELMVLAIITAPIPTRTTAIRLIRRRLLPLNRTLHRTTDTCIRTPPPQPQTQPQSSNGNDPAQNFYLIAFNDHTFEAATAYKVDDDQIHCITRDGQEKQAPLSSVDIRFSQQMNADRHVDFQIP